MPVDTRPGVAQFGTVAKQLLDNGHPVSSVRDVLSGMAMSAAAPEIAIPEPPAYDNPAYAQVPVPVYTQPPETPLQSGLAALGGMVREAMKHSAKQSMPVVSTLAAAGMNQKGFEAHQDRAATATNQANAQAAEDARQEALLAERVQEQQYQRQFQRQQLLANSVNSRAEMALRVDEAKYRADMARTTALQQAEDRRLRIEAANRPKITHDQHGGTWTTDPVTGESVYTINPEAQANTMKHAAAGGGGGASDDWPLGTERPWMSEDGKTVLGRLIKMGPKSVQAFTLDGRRIGSEQNPQYRQLDDGMTVMLPPGSADGIPVRAPEQAQPKATLAELADDVRGDTALTDFVAAARAAGYSDAEIQAAANTKKIYDDNSNWPGVGAQKPVSSYPGAPAAAAPTPTAVAPAIVMGTQNGVHGGVYNGQFHSDEELKKLGVIK